MWSLKLEEDEAATRATMDEARQHSPRRSHHPIAAPNLTQYHPYQASQRQDLSTDGRGSTSPTEHHHHHPVQSLPNITDVNNNSTYIPQSPNFQQKHDSNLAFDRPYSDSSRPPPPPPPPPPPSMDAHSHSHSHSHAYNTAHSHPQLPALGGNNRLPDIASLVGDVNLNLNFNSDPGSVIIPPTSFPPFKPTTATASAAMTSTATMPTPALIPNLSSPSSNSTANLAASSDRSPTFASSKPTAKSTKSNAALAGRKRKADDTSSIKTNPKNGSSNPIARPASAAATAGAAQPVARGVASLTAEQLAKKRANDREAQRAIRERTRRQMETLERRVQELTNQKPYLELQEALRKKEAVERENEEIKAKLKGVLDIVGSLVGGMSGGEGAGAAAWQQFNGLLHSTGASSRGQFSSHERLISGQPSFRSPVEGQFDTYRVVNGASGAAIPHVGSRYALPFNFVQYAGTGVSGLDPGRNNHFGLHTPMPLEFYLRLPINSAPTCQFDAVITKFLEDERHGRALGNGPTSASNLPSVASLLNGISEPKPKEKLLSSAEQNPLNSFVVSTIHDLPDISGLPEQVAAIWIMSIIMRWKLDPGRETYERLPQWLRPLEIQYRVPHPMWMDWIPSPSMREMMIDDRRQHLYTFDGWFQPFARELDVRWPKDALDALLLPAQIPQKTTSTTTAKSQTGRSTEPSYPFNAERRYNTAGPSTSAYSAFTPTAPSSLPSRPPPYQPYPTKQSSPSTTSSSSDKHRSTTPPSPHSESSATSTPIIDRGPDIPIPFADGTRFVINPVFDQHLRELGNWTMGNRFWALYPEMKGTMVVSSDERQPVHATVPMPTPTPTPTPTPVPVGGRATGRPSGIVTEDSTGTTAVGGNGNIIEVGSGLAPRPDPSMRGRNLSWLYAGREN